MSFHLRALDDASRALFAAMGRLDDLRPDLANTLANIYYKFYWMSYDPTIPPSALGVKDPIELVTERLTISHFHRTAENLIMNVRQARGEQRWLSEELALDIFKYRIEGAERKNNWRLAIERRLKKVHEIPGVYKAMVARLGRDA